MTHRDMPSWLAGCAAQGNRVETITSHKSVTCDGDNAKPIQRQMRAPSSSVQRAKARARHGRGTENEAKPRQEACQAVPPDRSQEMF